MADPLAENLAALRRRQPRLAHRIEHARPDRRLSAAEARDGTPIVLARDGGNERTLHSRYAPRREVDRRLHGTEGAATLVLFGAGAMIDARVALETRRTQAIIVVDLGPEVWCAILSIVPIAEMLVGGRLLLADGEDALIETLDSAHHAAIADRIALVELRAWTQVRSNRTAFIHLVDLARRTATRMAEELVSYRRFGTRWLVHGLHNSFRLSEHDRLERLAASCRGKRVTVLAAGPSAERAAVDLEPETTIAVDTIYPTLRRLGIAPLAVVSVDAHAWSALHLRVPLDDRTILVADLGVAPGLIHARSAAGWIPVAGAHPLHLLIARSCPSVVRTPRPFETVTEAAIQIARIAGATQVVLRGADYGYPRAKSYARGTYHYDIFGRSCGRTRPQEDRFAEWVYSRGAPPHGSPPFFPLPGAERARKRIADLLAQDLTHPAVSSPERSFSACAFWKHHIEEIDTAIARIKRDPWRSVPEFLIDAGPHAVAHLPSHAAFTKRAYGEPGTAFIESLVRIRAIVLTALSRYC